MTTTTTMMKTMMKTMIKSLANSEPLLWEWQQHRFRAMNTDIHLSMVAPRQKGLVRIVEESFRYFEQLLTRFRPTSELSLLNDSQDPLFFASPDFFAAVEAALWAAQQTGGVYDPTILVYLEEAGYDCTFAAVANPRPLLRNKPAADSSSSTESLADRNLTGIDYRHIGLDPFAQAISRPPGLRLDLGGMGKGWTVDRLADELCQKGHFLLNAGGDLYAYGSPGPKRGWEIHLVHPQKPELNFASLSLQYHAVATSTIARRRWVKNGVVQHHLIDPRTGRPAMTDVISVSVVAGRVFTAEVYAKVALILGIEEGLTFLEALPDVEGVLFSASGAVYLTSGMDQYLDRMDSSGY